MRAIFLSCFFQLLFTFSYGQDFEFVQQFEGISYSSAFYQNYLYYSPGDRIYVLDVSDSENIQHLDTVFQTEHTYYLLADTLNELLYSSRYGKTFIYSLSDPANPVRAGEIERGGSKVIRSDSLLIVGWSLNIWIYDISDLEQPVLLSSLTLEDSYGNICLNRNMLYSYMQPGFSGPQYIIGHDISDPVSPQYISLIIIGDPNDPSPVEMEAYDDKIFLARKDELKIFDIADQDTIIHLVDFFFPAESFAFKIKDELLYAALSTGMSIYDISDIYNISWLGQYEWGDQYGNIDVNGSLASLGYPPFGQKIITIDDPENMEEKYYNPNTADVHQVCKNNNLAYFCNWRIGIQVVDISNPLEPFNLDSLPFRPMHFMKFHDDFLYLKRINRDTIHIIDVGNPWRINYCGYVSFENHTNDYTFYDNMLLVNELDHGIRFIDISDPYSPFEVGFEAVGGSGIEVAEDYLYQFSNSSSNDAIISTFRVYDLSGFPGISLVDEVVFQDNPEHYLNEIIPNPPYVYLGFGLGYRSYELNDSLIFKDSILINTNILGFNFLYDGRYIYSDIGYYTNVVEINNGYELQEIGTYEHLLFNMKHKEYLYGCQGDRGYSLYNTPFNYDFPKPVNLDVALGNDNIHVLTWDPPERSPSSYNIYRNNVNIGKAYLTEYIDTADFVYYNTWEVTAVYENPNGESESDIIIVQIPATQLLPYEEDFEYVTAVWGTETYWGPDFWDLIDSVFHLGSQCAAQYSSIPGNAAFIYSTPLINETGEEVNILFWYKTLAKNNKHDELSLIIRDFQSQEVLYSEVLSPQNEWTEYYIKLEGLNQFNLMFEINNNCGGGSFVDDILVANPPYIINSPGGSFEAVIFHIFPNPANESMNISYSINSTGYVKVGLYTIQGKLSGILIDEEQAKGNYRFSMNTSNLPPGIYLVHFKFDDISMIKKLVLFKTPVN